MLIQKKVELLISDHHEQPDDADADDRHVDSRAKGDGTLDKIEIYQTPGPLRLRHELLFEGDESIFNFLSRKK